MKVNKHSSTTNVGSDYDEEEFAILKECDKYKSKHRIKFLQTSAVIQIMRQMGYRKVDQSTDNQDK